MFGLELWFVLAIISAVFGGLYIFSTKVAAERNYDVVLLSTATPFIAGVCFFVVTLSQGDFSGINSLVFFFVAVNAVLYFGVNVLRHYALQCIDTAIYYPIYKTLTPIVVIAAGVMLFHERFSLIEWVGLGLSLSVPLLLITHAEKGRQKDLWHGLRLLAITAFFAAIAAVAVKGGTEATENIWFYITLNDFGIALMGLLTLFYRNGKTPLKQRLKALQKKDFLWIMLWMSVTQVLSFASIVFAYDLGSVGVVYTVQSLYILIPIILSIIYYHEHWNARKVMAIVLSIAALGLLK